MRKLTGVGIDIALLSFVIYVGWVIALESLTYVEGIVRHDLLGYRASADPAEIGRQILSAPLISGRPVLFHSIITYIAPAITVLLYLNLLKLIWDGTSPGAMFANHRFGRTLASRGIVRWRKIIPAARAVALGEFQNKIADRLGLKDWQEVFKGLRKALGSVRDLAAPLVSLPAAARWMGWASLSAVLILSAAGPILYAHDAQFTHLTFEDVNSQIASIPTIAFYLSLFGLVVGWTVVLVGASMTNAVVLLVIGIFYIFDFVFIGIGGGRSWWIVLPQWMLLLLAASTPVPRRRWRWLRFTSIWALAALATFHSLRLTPLPRIAISPAWIVTVPVALIFAVLLRRRARLHVRLLSAIALGVNAIFVVLVLRAGPASVAGSLYYSVYQLMGVLTIFWFLLGSSYVDACIRLTSETIRSASRFLAERLYPTLLIVICLAELFALGELSMLRPSFMYKSAMGDSSVPILSIAGYQLSISRTSWLRIFSLPGHQGVVLALLLSATILSASGKYTPRVAKALTAVWTFSLLLIWAFFVQMIPLFSGEAHKPIDVLSITLERNNRILAMTLLSIAVVWVAFGGASRLYQQTKRQETGPGILLFSFGVLTLLMALSLFVFSSQTVTPVTANAYMYAGLDSLWIPITAYAAFVVLHAIGGNGHASIFASFVLGALIAGAVLFPRMVSGNPGPALYLSNLKIVSWGELLILIGTFAMVRSGRVADAVHASAIGLACAFGFAVSYTENLVLPLLGQWLNAFAALTAFRAIHGFARQLYDPSHASLIPFADGAFFYALAPVSAAIIGVLSFRAKKTGRMFFTSMIGVAVLALTVIYAIPLYQSELASTPLSFTPSLSIGAVGLVRSDLPILTYVLIPAIGASFYLLRLVYYSNNTASLEPGTD